jgi:hypothetical protein
MSNKQVNFHIKGFKRCDVTSGHCLKGGSVWLVGIKREFLIRGGLAQLSWTLGKMAMEKSIMNIARCAAKRESVTYTS